MKKRVTALLTALCCLCAPLTAYAESADVDVAFTYMTDTFTYRTNNQYGDGSGFYLESEIAEPDFMVVGYVHYEESPDLYDYVVSPINEDRLLKAGLGVMQSNLIVQELGEQQLRVGDLLKVDGDIYMAETETVGYFPGEPGTMSCLGNGVDVFGEEFAKVIRLQLVIDQTTYYQYGDRMYDIDLLHGDVNVDDTLSLVDVVSLNKSLMGAGTLCDYAKLAGDVNENSMLDAADSLMMLKETLGLTENFD